MSGVLIIPEKNDRERDAVAEAWQRSGGSVLRLGRFWEPPFVDDDVSLYGNDVFCQVLAQKLGLELISPADTLLTEMPTKYAQRQVGAIPLHKASRFDYPKFVKPAQPKLFPARVFESFGQLSGHTKGLPADTTILVSDVVDFVAEVRAFFLEGEVLDAAFYEGHGEGPLDFLESLAAVRDLPPVVVADVGRLASGAWAVVEFNAAWGSGLNGCSAELVLPAIKAATVRTY